MYITDISSPMVQLEFLSTLRDARKFINPPKPNCYCNTCFPCGDCIDYAEERDVADRLDNCIKLLKEAIHRGGKEYHENK